MQRPRWLAVPSRTDRLPRVVALGALHLLWLGLAQALVLIALAALAALVSPSPPHEIAPYDYPDSAWLDGWDERWYACVALVLGAPFVYFLVRLSAARWRPQHAPPRSYLWLQTLPGACALALLSLDALAAADQRAKRPPLAFDSQAWHAQPELRPRMLDDLVATTRFVGLPRAEIERRLGPAAPIERFADLDAPLVIGCPNAGWFAPGLGFEFDPVTERCVRAVLRDQEFDCSELR